MSDNCCRDATLTEGATLTLTARAEGKGDITHQWLRNGQPIPGAVGTSLRVRSMGAADGGGFACRALNARGIATSRSATISVTPKCALRPTFVEWNSAWQYIHSSLQGNTRASELRVNAAAARHTLPDSVGRIGVASSCGVAAGLGATAVVHVCLLLLADA